MATQFGTAYVDAGSLTLVSGPGDSGSSIAVDSSWNGRSSIELLDSSASNFLQTGDTFTISFEVEVDPREANRLTNQVSGSGDGVTENGDPIVDSNGNPLTANDLSDSGTETGDTNPGEPGDFGTPDDPTPVELPATPLSEITGTVFEDLNNDGIHDPNEPGIPGVEVILTGVDVYGDPVSITVLTDADGQFTFDGLNAGTYEINQSQPEGFDDGLDNGESAWTIGNDTLSNIILGFGETNSASSFGEVRGSTTSGNPPNLRGLPPIFVSPISNLLNGFTGSRSTIYSGSAANPVSLQSNRPITGGYSVDVSEACGCPTVVEFDECEACDPCAEETRVLEEIVEVQACVDEVIVECGECEESVPVEEGAETDACAEECIESDAPCDGAAGSSVRRPFLKRFFSWLK